jgi:hypothetical protein
MKTGTTHTQLDSRATARPAGQDPGAATSACSARASLPGHFTVRMRGGGTRVTLWSKPAGQR